MKCGVSSRGRPLCLPYSRATTGGCPYILRTSHCSFGFTFVELLATLVLISLVMPVVMETIGLCTRVAGQSRREIEAVCLAKSKLSELTAGEDWQTGSSRGDFGNDWPGYEWSIAVTNWPDDTNVREIDLTVTWRSAGRDRKTTLSTLVYPQQEQ